MTIIPKNYDAQVEIALIKNLTKSLPSPEEYRVAIENIGQLDSDENIAKVIQLKERIFDKIQEQPLDKWKDIIPKPSISTLKYSDGTPLIYKALSNPLEDPLNIIELFQYFDAQIKKTTDAEGRSAMHAAAFYGQLKVAEYLQKSIANIHQQDSFNRSPFYDAILSGHEHMVNFMLEEGAGKDPIKTLEKDLNVTLKLGIKPPNETSCQKEVAIYPFAIAIISTNEKIFDRLLTHHKTSSYNWQLTSTIPNIGNLIHLAIFKKEMNMLRHLVKHPQLKEMLNESCYGKTPLQLASYLGDRESVYLLCQQGIDVNMGSFTQNGTALHFAARGLSDFYKKGSLNEAEEEENLKLDRQFLEVIEELLIAGANPNLSASKSVLPLTLIPEDSFCYTNLEGFIERKVTADESRTNFKKNPPFYLAFQGGGSKGISYVGALQELEREQLLKAVKSVAGTSVGAIMATLIAVGYQIQGQKDSLEQVIDKDFIDLLGIKNKKINNMMTNLSIKGVAINVLKEGLFHILTPSRKSLKIKFVEYIQKITQLQAISDGNEFREWIDKLIEKKTGIQNLTFGELSEFIIKNPDKNCKHLHIIAAQYQDGAFKSVEFHTNDCSKNQKENKEWEDTWKDLIISDAVRASVSIPYIFSTHTLHFKKNEHRYAYQADTYKNFIDGGVVKNYPLEIFNRNQFQEVRSLYGEKTNKRVLGFNLHEIHTPFEKELKESPRATIWETITGDSLLKGIFSTYLNLGEILVEEKQWNKDCTITIPVEGVTAISMKLTGDQKNRMIIGGSEAAKSFLQA